LNRRKFFDQSIRVALASGLGMHGLSAHIQRRPEYHQSNNNIHNVIRELETLLPALLKQANVAGLSIALVDEGKLAWSKGFGVCDTDSKKPVNEDTVFEIASISKTVFAYAIMKLVEQNVINLDKPLIEYWSQPVLAGDPRSSQITARHILSHQSGLQNWRTPQEPLQFFFDPGKGFLYSGEGYFYLQSVLTHLRGKVDTTTCGTYEADVKVCATDIGQYLEREILIPMKMNSSAYISLDKIKKNYALPHGVDGKTFSKNLQTATDLARYAAAGGLFSTVNDYAHFMTSVFKPKENDRFRLNKNSIEAMFTPQVKLPADQQIDGAASWALGWAVQERVEGNVILHSGGQAGYRSLAMLSPQRKSGFVMLTNSDNGGYILYDQKVGAILNRLLPA
jgi:CubicO group peptidase (beta-lactamase class C family)